MTMKSVGTAAFQMVEEVRRQLREHPGIKDGTETPEYIFIYYVFIHIFFFFTVTRNA